MNHMPIVIIISFSILILRSACLYTYPKKLPEKKHVSGSGEKLYVCLPFSAMKEVSV